MEKGRFFLSCQRGWNNQLQTAEKKKKNKHTKPAWNKNMWRWVGHSEIVFRIKSANTGVIIETGVF